MKFKLVELFSYDDKLNDAYDLVHEYLYDAIDELKNRPLEDYLTWYKNELSIHIRNPKVLETAVRDEYIEAIDCGKINRPKTMITSQLKDYLESNSNLLDNVDVLMNNCPEHLRQELQLALDVAELNESLNEDLLTEKMWFTVTHNDPKKRTKDFYLYSVDASDAQESLKHIFKLSTGNHAKQSFDKDVKLDLLSTYPSYNDLIVLTPGTNVLPVSNILSKTSVSFRK